MSLPSFHGLGPLPCSLRARTAAVLVCSALAATDVMAATALSATRMVLREAEGSSSINVRNDDDAPTLIQAWIDDGRTQVSPELIDTPFQVVPPLLRVEAGASRLLRVQRVRPDALPGDRESLFWLNLMEIPRKAEGQRSSAAPDQANRLDIRVRSRIKLIYRPAVLESGKQDRLAQVDWMPAAQGRAVCVRNGSPWVLNLADGRLGESSLQLGNGVVLPMSSREFLLSAPPTQARVDFQWVDDHGALHPAHALLEQPVP